MRRLLDVNKKIGMHRDELGNSNSFIPEVLDVICPMKKDRKADKRTNEDSNKGSLRLTPGSSDSDLDMDYPSKKDVVAEEVNMFDLDNLS